MSTPHDYKSAIARALEMERDIERSEEENSAAHESFFRSARVVGVAALFCLTYVILLYGQLTLFNSANVFTTLALNVGLWIGGLVFQKRTR